MVNIEADYIAFEVEMAEAINEDNLLSKHRVGLVTLLVNLNDPIACRIDGIHIFDLWNKEILCTILTTVNQMSVALIRIED